MVRSAYVNFRLDEQDKAWLEALARLNGDASMSAILRRLIREEAERHNIQVELSTEDKNVRVA